MDQIMELLSYDKEEMKTHLEKYEKKDIPFLRKGLCELKKEQGSLVCQKHYFQKKEDAFMISSLRSRIGKINCLKKLILERIDLLFINEVKRQRKENLPVFLKMESSSMRDLDYLSQFLGEEVTEKLKSLENIQNSKQKLIIMDELLPVCEEMYASMRESLEKTYQEFADFLGISKNRDMKKKVQNKIRQGNYVDWSNRLEYLQMVLQKLSLVIERLYTLRGIYKNAVLKEYKDLNRSYISLFEENTREIILGLVGKSLYQDNTFVERINSILNKDIFWQFDEVYPCLEKVTDAILASFSEQEQENTICLCNVMKNLIISKANEIKRYLTKEEAKEYTKKLRNLAKKFERVKKASIEKTVEKKNTAYLEILLLLLENPKNYYYMERIIDTVSSKMDEESLDDLLGVVIDSFVKNYKLKIANQKLEYTDPNYYFQMIDVLLKKGRIVSIKDEKVLLFDKFIDSVVDAFIQNYDRKVRKQELAKVDLDYLGQILKLFLNKGFISPVKRKEVSQKLDKFYKQLCERGKSPECEEALMALEELNNKEESLSNKQDINLEIKKTVEERIHYFRYYQKGKKENDSLTKTFAIGKFAYSIAYNEEGDTYFRIHLLDSSALLFANDSIDEKMKKHMLLNQKYTFDLPYQEGKSYPAITLQYRIYKNGKYRFQVFEDCIQMDEVYNKNEFEHYRDIPALKELVSSYKKLHKKGNRNTLDTYTESIASSEILSIFATCPKEVPCMYKRSLAKAMESTQIKNHNQICHLLAKIDKKTAHQIYAILEEQREDIYCNYRTEDAYLTLDPFSYDTIYLYRTLKSILKGTYDFNEHYDRNQKEVEMYCKVLNTNRGYVSELFFERESQKVKK